MALTPTITIHVTGPLRTYCAGAKQLTIQANTVRAALDGLERGYSALYRNICDETGRVRQHLNVFVNSDNVRDGNGVDTKLAPGDVVTILPAVSGGCNMADRVILTIGTKKGVFVAEASKPRCRFALRGPFGAGVPVYSTLIDTRGTPRLYASSCNPFFGMKVLRSTDMGKTFQETKSAPAFPKDDGRALANIWALEAGSGKKELWCGVEPASLFRSRDGGDSWDMVPGISNHDHARKWHPGNGGLCLHTIVRDSNRVHLGISTGGHYLSEDGGETFTASNKGVGAGFAPDPYPEFGQCVHKIARHDGAPGRLYMQNHGGWADWTGPGGPRPGIGVLRSDDYGRSWRSIAKGLPSDFGFPIVVHPHDPDIVYVVPLAPMTRSCPGGAPAVWRSENGGGSWNRLSRGLPRKESFFTVLRDAMDIDRLKTPALYFGTTTGQLWIGREGGEQWDCLFDSLPPIHNVKVGVV